MPTLPATDIRRLVRLGLLEDLEQGDATTSALFPAALPARACIVAQQPLVVAGMAAAVQTFLAIDGRLQLSVSRRDGQPAKSGETLLEIEGDGRSILMAERVALNFLQHLSGIATLTRRFCEAVKPYPVQILDTRKTLPGWRTLQKWAVALGGGVNHRLSLGDGILIKDNHLVLLNKKRQVVQDAVQQARRRAAIRSAIIVEVESLPQVREALAVHADIILLDNMTLAMVKRAVKLIKRRALVEVSGGVTLENVRAMAAAGPDRISVGALTHSAPAATISLDLLPRASRRRDS